MPKQAISFGDGIQRIVADLAQMELDPAADRSLIANIRETIISFQQAAMQSQGPAAAPVADSGPGAIPGTLDMGAPPVDPMAMDPAAMGVPPEDLSRGPRPNVDTSGAVEELSRVMAGS